MTLSIPYSFNPSTTISSSQMNANFAAVATWAGGNIGEDNLATLGGAVNWSISSNVKAINISIASTQPAVHVSASGSGVPLQLDSTSRGALLPRMTSAQRVAIASPAEGEVVFDTDTNALYTYSGSGWEVVGTASPIAKNSCLNPKFTVKQYNNVLAVSSLSKVYRYLVDGWYVGLEMWESGSSETNQVALSRQTGELDGSSHALKIIVSSDDINGSPDIEVEDLEFWHVLTNEDSLAYYNGQASVGVYVKAFGNVNQMGIQLYYKTSEGQPDVAIGSEVFTTVNSSGYTLVKIDGQAIGTSITRSGCLGVRIRMSDVSSGELSNLGNGFQIEKPMWNPGAALAAFTCETEAVERARCLAQYERSYLENIVVGTTTDTGTYTAVSTSGAFVNVRFNQYKRSVPTITMHSSTGAAGKFRDTTGTADVNANSAEATNGGFFCSSAVTNGNSFRVHWVADARPVSGT